MSAAKCTYNAGMSLPETSATRSVSSSTGKFAVIGMLLVAVLAASFAWWWNYNRGRQSLAFYGAEAATLIRTAPKVELLSDAGDINISKAPGLLNARASLLSDASYHWDESNRSEGAFTSAVRFSDGQRHVVVEFDFNAHSVRTSSTGQSTTVLIKTAEGWRAFLARQAVTTPPEPARTDPSE
jgi:hypothetical protein